MLRIKLILAVLLLPTLAIGAPSKPSVSGTVAHGNTITISGSSFGTKTTAAPTIWDNASGTNIRTLWSGAWPDTDAQSAYQTTYRTPAQVGRGVPLPHAFVTKYISGAHYSYWDDPYAGEGRSNTGINVLVWHNYTSSLPEYWYASYYVRYDDNWQFGSECNTGGEADNNFKVWDYSTGTSPYTGSDYTGHYYIDYTGQTCSKTSVGDLTVNMNTITGTSRPGTKANPFNNSWVKTEVEFYASSSSSGFVRYYENGQLVNSTTLTSDPWTAGSRVFAIGGYSRHRGSSEWRYYNDVYLDRTLQRAVLCPGSTWATRGVCQNVIPSAWSATSITATVNQGALANSSTAYLYVVDAAGDASPASDPITIGSGGGDGTPPSTTISTSDPSAISTDALTVTGSASDAVGVSGCKWRIGSAPDGSNGASCTGTTSFSCSTSGYSSGANTLYVGCYDAAGNYGSDSITVNYTPVTATGRLRTSTGAPLRASGGGHLRVAQ